MIQRIFPQNGHSLKKDIPTFPQKAQKGHLDIPSKRTFPQKGHSLKNDIPSKIKDIPSKRVKKDRKLGTKVSFTKGVDCITIFKKSSLILS
jgi:hypothetical protein